mgnify:CR=1 FL=1
MVRTSFDFSDITREEDFARMLNRRMQQAAWNNVRVVSFNVERRIKIKMPVDTGRARASWGHSTAPASPADGIWIEDEHNLAITQGSAVEYIEQLNEGSSQQAPAGFIDAEERAGAEELSQKIADDMARLF